MDSVADRCSTARRCSALPLKGTPTPITLSFPAIAEAFPLSAGTVPLHGRVEISKRGVANCRPRMGCNDGLGVTVGSANHIDVQWGTSQDVQTFHIVIHVEQWMYNDDQRVSTIGRQPPGQRQGGTPC